MRDVQEQLPIFTVNSHKLVHAKDGGNGYHGRCKWCGLALVTDLGWSSWDGIKCVDRDSSFYELSDFPEQIQSFVRFKGLRWDKTVQKFVKPFSQDEYTPTELNAIINALII